LWEFDEARKLAIDTLYTMDIDSVTRIELARTYDIRQWYWAAIRTLVEQDKRLDDRDAQRLGLKFSTRIMELRGFVAGLTRTRKYGDLGISTSLLWQFIRDFFPEVKGLPLPTGKP
jgi:hypothetical protein